MKPETARRQPGDAGGSVLSSLLWPPECPEGSGAALDQAVAADLDLGPLIQALSGYDSRREPFVARLLTALCADPAVIAYRAEIVRNLLDEPELRRRLTALLPALSPLAQERRRSLFGVEWTVTEILERVSELQLYVEAALAVAEALDTPLLRALALCALRSSLRALVETAEFRALQEILPELVARLGSVQSVTIGVNLSSGFLPESATILSIDAERVEGRGGLLHRLLGGDAGRHGITHLRRPPRGGSGAFLPPMGENGRGPENELIRDLRRLLERVAEPVGHAIERYTSAHLRDFVALESELAFLLNGVALLDRLRGAGLPICYPEIAPAEERTARLDESYSVSLALRMLGTAPADGRSGGATELVTNPVRFNASEGRVWILTGPNRGGKTTFARAAGQAQLLFQAGLFVPARRARLSPVDAVYTHFPHQERATTGEGRLDDEAKRLASIFRAATPRSLIVLNEVLSGTSTPEALALARDAVRGLRLLGARAVYVTHLHELATQVEEINSSTPGDGTVGSLVAEVDERPGEEAGEPRRTFRIRPGAPLGCSYASEIAEQHGISYRQLRSLLEERGAALKPERTEKRESTMTESTPIPNGPFPSYTLDPPQHPPRMTREQVIARVKYNFRYPDDMPDEIWRTEFGALQEWDPPYPSVREEGTPWTKHVWKVTATGERLADYFIPTNRDEKPDPNIVLGMLIEDSTGSFYESGRTWRLSGS